MIMAEIELACINFFFCNNDLVHRLHLTQRSLKIEVHLVVRT